MAEGLPCFSILDCFYEISYDFISGAGADLTLLAGLVESLGEARWRTTPSPLSKLRFRDLGWQAFMVPKIERPKSRCRTGSTTSNCHRHLTFAMMLILLLS